jgi:hypothetical protein
MNMRIRAAVLAFAGIFLLDLRRLHACAVCLTGADGSVAEAYDWSVLFLMAAPYLVVGSIGGFLLFAYRRAAEDKSADEAVPQAALPAPWNQKESGR